MNAKPAGSLFAYLRLMRFPAVFTTSTDITLGYLLSGQSEATVPYLFLLLASACIYLAGMVFNDYYDREEDARERPNRPIPSGQISPGAARKLGTTLIAIGLAAAMTVSIHSAFIAFLLIVFVWAYDSGGKKTFLGPFLMGGCRGLDILLGASLIPWSDSRFNLIAVIAVCMAGYIGGVTLFARHEAGPDSKKAPSSEFVLLLLPLIILLIVVTRQPGYEQRGVIALILITGIIAHRAFRAVINPQPKTVQAAIKTMLMSLITIEAALVYALIPGSLPWVIFMLLLYIPMFLLVRMISIT